MAESNAISLPPGWEAKFNEQAKRYYFVDHITKKTQWEDPRLNHPFIWGQSENITLHQLQSKFTNVPELIIRETLLKCGFNARDAQNELNVMISGQTVTLPTVVEPTEGNAPHSKHVRASPIASPKTASTPIVDEFALMSVKSKFPEVSNFVIEDVLNSLNQDVEKTVKELTKDLNMKMGVDQFSTKGFHPKTQQEQKTERIAMDKEEKRKLKDKHNEECFSQLKQEFSSMPLDTLKEVFANSNSDLVEARSALRQFESKRKLEALLKIAEKDRQKATDDAARKQETESSAAFVVQSPEENQGKKSNQQTQVEQTKSLAPTAKNEKRTHRHEKTKTSEKKETTSHAVTAGAAIKPSLAKGPDTNLRHGPDDKLRLRDRVQPHGPDASLLHGACKDLLGSQKSEIVKLRV